MATAGPARVYARRPALLERIRRVRAQITPVDQILDPNESIVQRDIAEIIEAALDRGESVIQHNGALKAQQGTAAPWTQMPQMTGTLTTQAPPAPVGTTTAQQPTHPVHTTHSKKPAKQVYQQQPFLDYS